MGNQPSSEVKAEFGTDGDLGLASSRPSNPPYTQDIVFSSQVPPSTNRRLPPDPNHQPYDQSDSDPPSSPPPPQPIMTSPKQNIKLEIPESPDYSRQASSPNPTSSKSKKRRRRNRPSLVSSQPLSASSHDARNNEIGVDDSPLANERVRPKKLKHRKKEESGRKRAQLQESPDLGNLEVPGDPVESTQTQKTQQDTPLSLRFINNTTPTSSPSASLPRKRKAEGSASQGKKKQKRSHGERNVGDAPTSFSGLAESLYARRKKNRRPLEAIEDDSIVGGGEREPPDSPEQENISRDSSASVSNMNSDVSGLGRTLNGNADSGDKMEVEPPEDDSASHGQGRPGSASNGSDHSDASSENQDHATTNGDGRSGGGAERSSEDEGSVHDGDNDTSPHVASVAETTNEEHHLDDDELREGSENGHGRSSFDARPRHGSARRRIVKPNFFERETERSTNGTVQRASSPVAGPSNSTGRKQAKISSMLKGNAGDSPEPKASSSKPRPAPKNTQPHELITGQFSEFELRNITQAVERWRDDHNLTQSEVNALIQGNPREVKSHEFWARIVATCPNRRRQKVINQCRRKFHNFVARGTWTPEQHDELKTMWEMYGNKYAQIGKMINRHPEDVRDRIRNYVVCGENRRVDPWTLEEEGKLQSIISEALSVIRDRRLEGHLESEEPDEDLIDWQRVSELMDRTRSRLQCMQKWKLMNRQRRDGGSIDGGKALPVEQIIMDARNAATAMSSQDRYNVVKAIRAYGVNADSRIPWAKVRTKQLADQWSRPTLMIVWYRLKNTVPDWRIMTVPEIIKQLSAKYRETRQLDFPSGDDYDLEAEYDEVAHKIKKILMKAQRAAKTPRSVIRTDDDEEDVADDDDESSADDESGEDGTEISKGQVGESEENTQSGDENETIPKKNERSENGDNQQDEDGNEGNESVDEKSGGEELSAEDGADQKSDGSVDLGHTAENDGSIHRESSTDAPSISNFKSKTSRRGQKRYSSSSRATRSRGPTPSKPRSTAEVIEESSEAEQALDVDEELSSDTNASEVESIPAH